MHTVADLQVVTWHADPFGSVLFQDRQSCNKVLQKELLSDNGALIQQTYRLLYQRGQDEILDQYRRVAQSPPRACAFLLFLRVLGTGGHHQPDLKACRAKKNYKNKKNPPKG